MGLHIENDRRLYWSQKATGPLHQPVFTAMSRDRWLNIDRALSISDLLVENETVFEKVGSLFDFLCNLLTNQKIEPLSTHIWKKAQELWIPGRDLAVDEIMETLYRPEL